MRLQYTLVFLLLTSIMFGQKSTLFKNINGRAKELKHELNKTGDSILLKCDRTIFEAVIFNKDYEKVIGIRGKEAKIPIAVVPVGKYVVEVLLRDKLIVFTLIRNKAISIPKIEPLLADNSNLIGKIETIKKVNLVKKSIQKPKELIGTESKTKKTKLAVAGKKSISVGKRSTEKKYKPKLEVKRVRVKKTVSTYWVVYVINNGTSSLKTQRLGNQDDVDRMIKKIEIDMKTKTGRLNELTVWKVFNTSEFAEHKRNNKLDYMNIASESFKTEPYYQKVNKFDNL